MSHDLTSNRDLEKAGQTAVLGEGVVIPPSEDDLPHDDGEPMESERHLLQMHLLIECLKLHWGARSDFYVGGNMFVYWTVDQATEYRFRGPDVFVVLDVPRRERKSWVVWQERKGPDVVVELLSESTAAMDRGEKKLIYQNELRVPEYFLYDPFDATLEGFVLTDGEYQPVEEQPDGALPSARLGLTLVRWTGQYEGVEATWARWATPDGKLLETHAERAERLAEKLRALGVDPDET